MSTRKTVFLKKGITFAVLILTMCSNAFAQKSTEDALALQYYKSGEYTKAVEIYDKLYKSNPQYYYDAYLNALIKSKKYEEAEKIVNRMMRGFPANPAYAVDFGRLLQEQGKNEKSEEWYNKLIKDLPKNEFAVRELSIAFYRAEAFDHSIKTLLTGRKLLHDETAFAFDLISLYRFQKDKSPLAEEYLNLLSHNQEEALLNQAKNTFINIFESAEDFNFLRAALLRKIQKEPQNIAFIDLLAWTYLQQQEYNLALKQIISLDKRLKAEGERVYELATLLISNKSYETAIEALDYLVNKGTENSFFIPSKILRLNAKNELLKTQIFTTTELEQLEKEYYNLLEELGQSRNTISAVRQLAALQAYYLNKAKDAETLLENALNIPNLPPSVLAMVKLELGDVYIINGEVWEAALIFGQVEKDFSNEPNGHEAKFRGAKLSYFQGEFTWAKAQLDVLKGSTSQLIANDALNLSLLMQENLASTHDTSALKRYALADLLIFKNQNDKALAVLDSIDNSFPNNSLEDDILMSKAKIFLKQNKLEQAVSQLNIIVENHSSELWADDALFILGDLYETKLKDPLKAKAFFQKIIANYPGSPYLPEARKRFRNLRGDIIG